jgi:tRNA dimethylallyltransferase
MQQGMIQEVRNLLAKGISHERLEALGLEYRFISLWLRGEFSSESEMVQRLKYAIHDFTRRQLTWFRRDKRIVWVDGIEGDEGNDALLCSAMHCIQLFLNVGAR